jgi:hypothetical protein
VTALATIAASRITHEIKYSSVELIINVAPPNDAECFGKETTFNGARLWDDKQLALHATGTADVICITFQERNDTRICATGTHVVCQWEPGYDARDGKAFPLWLVDPGFTMCGNLTVATVEHDHQQVYHIMEPHPMLRYVSRFGFNEDIYGAGFPYPLVYTVETSMFELEPTLQKKIPKFCNWFTWTPDARMVNPPLPENVTHMLLQVTYGKKLDTTAESMDMWFSFNVMADGVRLYGDIQRTIPENQLEGFWSRKLSFWSTATCSDGLQEGEAEVKCAPLASMTKDQMWKELPSA